MALIGNIAIGMSVDSAGMDKGLSKASSSLKGFGSEAGKSLGSFPGLDKLTGAFGQLANTLTGGFASKAIPQISELGSSLSSVASVGGGALGTLAAGAIAAAAAIAAATAAVIAFGVSSIGPAASLIHLSERLGTTTDGLRELHYAAKMSGSEAESMDHAIGKLSINLGKAAHGATPAGMALEQIGLSAKDLARMDPADAMKAIIENFDKFPTAADQAAAAMELFGKGGVGILGTLKLGKEGLAKLTAETQGMKGALEGVKGKQILEANESMEKLSMAWSGLGTILAVDVAPLVTSVMGTMVGWLKAAGQEGNVVHDVFKAMIATVAQLGKGIAIAWAGASGLYDKINPKEKRSTGSSTDFLHNGAGLTGRESAMDWGERMSRAKGPPEETKKAAAISHETIEAIAKGREWQTTLRDQVATFGMTADAAELYKLSIAGIPQQDVKNIGSLIQLKAQMENNKAVWALMASDAKKFYEDTRTPAEVLIEQQTKLNWLLTNGMISQDTFDRGMKKNLTDKAKGIIDETRTPIETYQKSLGELEQLLRGGAIDTETFNRAAGAAEKAAVGDNKPRFAQMADMGSKEAYSAILQFQAQSNRADDPQKKLVKNSDEAIKIAREHLELAKRGTTGNTLPVYQFGA
jgi:hypothetical protein